MRLYLGHVTTYPGVVWSFMLCGSAVEVDGTVAAKRAGERGLSFRYWTPEVHEGAFALPGIVVDGLSREGRNPFVP